MYQADLFQPAQPIEKVSRSLPEGRALQAGSLDIVTILWITIGFGLALWCGAIVLLVRHI